MAYDTITEEPIGTDENTTASEEITQEAAVEETPKTESSHVATEVDQSWRTRGAANTHGATEVDQGWRQRAAGMLDPNSAENKARANHFADMAEFKEAAAKLTVLTSSEGTEYAVKGVVSKDGGQAIVLLCEAPNGSKVVAKVHYEPLNSKQSAALSRARVLEYMGTPAGQNYTVAVMEIGWVMFGDSKYYFEVMPFCEEGDVSDDGEFSFEEIVSFVKQINEAFHSIHQSQIIHGDIKPQNIYKVGGRYLIGDFGTAKATNENTIAQTTTVARSRGYTAPELLLAVSDDPTVYYTKRIDYYSLGVTVASLYEGHFIYEGVEERIISQCVQKGKLPFVRLDAHREHIENLVEGLCRFDPQQRFGYEDVNEWLKNPDYRGGFEGEQWPKAFVIGGQRCTDEQSLFTAMTKDPAHWEEAKKMLFSNIVEPFFSSFRTDLTLAAKEANEQYRTSNPDKGLSVFLKKLFPPGPIVWRGYTFESLSALASGMVVAQNPSGYVEILNNRCISHWLDNTEGITVPPETRALVGEIEGTAATLKDIACYWFGNAFAPERKLSVCGQTVSDVAGLVSALFASPKTFYRDGGCNMLCALGDANAFVGFLYSLGYRKVVEETVKAIHGRDAFGMAVIMFGMLDAIAEKEGVNTDALREFFVTFGPLGIATYTQKLVKQSAPKVYTALDSEGANILSKISAFKARENGNLQVIYTAHLPLIELVDTLQRHLTDNPHLVLAGVYDQKGVLCRNLLGCFAFSIFERQAPLGFQALIDNGNGGAQ